MMVVGIRDARTSDMSRDTLPEDMTPCTATFERLACTSPEWLRDWIISGILSDSHLMLAVEAMGRVDDTRMAHAVMIPMLRHPKCYVRAAALTGLETHLDNSLYHHLREIADGDILECIQDQARVLLDELRRG